MKLHQTFLSSLLTMSEISIMKPRGEIVELAFNSAFTHFDTNDFVKQSKKTRSHKVESRAKDILTYSVVGKCITYKNRGSNTTFIIRNVVDLCSFEMTFFLFSPLLKYYCIRDVNKKTQKMCYKNAKAYFLRKSSPSKSQVPFEYVIE